MRERKGGKQLEAIGVHGQEDREDILWRKADRNVNEDEYESYLRSPEWKVRREGMLDIANNQCELCTSSELLTVHHCTYNSFGKEEPRDLVLLCWRCHIDVQGRPPYHPLSEKVAKIAATHPATFTQFFMDEEGGHDW